MNQEAIIEETRRVLTQLLPDGPVDLYFRHDYQPEEGDQRHTSDGDPPLEFFISPRGEGQASSTVHIVRIGNTTAVDGLPVAAVPESDGLPDDIWVKDDPFRPDYDEHQPQSAQHYGLYTHICQQLKPATILEIGVRGGYSAWSMLRAAPEATYLGIDLNQGTWGGEVGYISDAFAMLRRTYPQAAVSILEGDSQSIDTLPQTFDLIHVDGHHGHDETLHDLELCFPYADHLIIDDVGFVTTVLSAVNEFLERHPGAKATRYDSWRGLVHIDTRPATSNNWWPGHALLFESPTTVEEARTVILNPEADLQPEDRWRNETPWLLERIVFPPGVLLDIGCGIGRLSGPLAQRGDHAVIGVDFSAAMRRMALAEVDLPERFMVTTLPYLTKLVASDLRAQGALALWVLQHLPEDQLTSLVPFLWQALEPGAALFTLDRERCIPITDGKTIAWWNDNFDICALLEREGFMLHTTEEPPRTACGEGAFLRRWIRRR